MSPSRDIPFNQLVLSQSNVRRAKAGISIGDLAEDLGPRRPLQSLNVRSVLNADGQETGMFEVPAGGRRYLMRKPAEGLATADPVAALRAILMLFNDS